MQRSRWLVLFVVAAMVLLPLTASAHPGDQHGPGEGHLIGDGASGTLELVGQVAVHDVEEGLIADLAIYDNYAYLARWGGSVCEGPERRGQQSPDGGVYIIDISDLANPVEVGFIATHQDTLVGEGMQVLKLQTDEYSGNVLAMNHEGCGKNFKGGFSLWDVTDPVKPRKLSEHFGDFTVNGANNTPNDANQYHSVFMWQDNGRAFLVATDDMEGPDVDIYDISNPKKPVLLTELNLNAYNVSQPELYLSDAFLHDMVVKEINEKQIMLLSYWDGGYVLLDVDDPAAPIFLGDSDYAAVDPEVPGVTPEGNGHQAEFTDDNQFVIATDEDFSPYVLSVQTTVGNFPARLGSNTTSDQAASIQGATTFVGRACVGDPAVPAGGAGYDIAVVERGLCTFQEKLVNVLAATGWDALLIMNREGADGCNALLTPLIGGDIPVAFIPRDAGFRLFGAAYDLTACMAGSAQAPIAMGAAGATVNTVDAFFDGWGYVHLFAANPTAGVLEDVDTFAIPEAVDPAYAAGFGDLSVHEVATHPEDSSRAYLSYYSGGMRALQIQCADPSDKLTCDLVEVGRYLDPNGNNFWGVEVRVFDGKTYVFGSDRDSGLWIFEDKSLAP